jgi:hypothetical protein
MREPMLEGEPRINLAELHVSFRQRNALMARIAASAFSSKSSCDSKGISKGSFPQWRLPSCPRTGSTETILVSPRLANAEALAMENGLRGAGGDALTIQPVGGSEIPRHHWQVREYQFRWIPIAPTCRPDRS